MKRVSKFLNIEFDVVMCTPTIFGQVWGGNASSMTQFSQISSTRINKWSQELTDAEVRILEHFLKPYLQKHVRCQTNCQMAMFLPSNMCCRKFSQNNISGKQFRTGLQTCCKVCCAPFPRILKHFGFPKC